MIKEKQEHLAEKGIDSKKLMSQRFTKIPLGDPKARCMVRYNDPKRVRWDLFVIILAVWNSFFIPFNIAFEPEVSTFVEIINILIDVLFLVDIIVNFRSTLITK